MRAQPAPGRAPGLGLEPGPGWEREQEPEREQGREQEPEPGQVRGQEPERGAEWGQACPSLEPVSPVPVPPVPVSSAEGPVSVDRSPPEACDASAAAVSCGTPSAPHAVNTSASSSPADHRTGE